jgi:hypothetical protein
MCRDARIARRKDETMDRNAALEEVRKRMASKKGGRQRDPNEWRPPQIKVNDDPKNEGVKFKFIVLPPLNKGEVCAGGIASRSMDLYHNTVAQHWINNRPYECPRIHDGVECPFCSLGFDLLSNTDVEQTRKDIAKAYLPRTYYPMNIYFPPFASTPEELRNTVKWYACHKTVNDIMSQTLMRDSAGDPVDPQAYGFFYLPDESYVFQLEIHPQSQFNDYKKSRFLPNTRGPIVKKAGTNEADVDAINKILAQRHDLFTKYQPRDVEALRKLADAVLKGGDEAPAEPAIEDTLVETPIATKVETPKETPKQEAPKAPATKAPVSKPKPAPAAPVEDPELDALLGEITGDTTK